MGLSNEDLYEVAKDAIDDLFNDASVDKETTKGNLQGLRDEIDMFLESFED